MKHWRWSVLVPVLVLFATACSSSSTSAPPSAPQAGASSATGDVSVALNQWSVAPSAIAFSAGSVTFAVTNQGTMNHEFVVLRTDTQAADIPVASFEGETGRINEDTAGTNVGETGDLVAAATKSLTVNLKPGHYVFFCNLPGHYESGMHVDVTVT